MLFRQHAFEIRSLARRYWNPRDEFPSIHRDGIWLVRNLDEIPFHSMQSINQWEIFRVQFYRLRCSDESVFHRKSLWPSRVVSTQEKIRVGRPHILGTGPE